MAVDASVMSGIVKGWTRLAWGWGMWRMRLGGFRTQTKGLWTAATQRQHTRVSPNFGAPTHLALPLGGNGIGERLGGHGEGLLGWGLQDPGI